MSREFEAKFYSIYNGLISNYSSSGLLDLGHVGNAILNEWLGLNFDNLANGLPVSKMSITDYSNMMQSYKDISEPPYDTMGYNPNYGFDLALELFLEQL